MALVETAKFPAAVATETDMLNWKNVTPAVALPTLLNGVASTDTTIALAVGTGSALPNDNFVASIDSEVIFVASRTGDTLNGVTRGFEGSSAASHIAGAVVSANVTAKAHNQLVSEVFAVEQALGVKTSNLRRNAVQSFTVSTGNNQTPVLDASTYDAFKFTLQANVTSSTLNGAVAGQIIVVALYQDGVGGRTFAWPTNFVGAGNVAGNAVVANAVARQVFWFDGTNAYAISALLVN